MKLDRRQLAAYIVIVLFMAVTIGHVANYTGSFEPVGWQWLGFFYALAVDASIAVCAWLTRWATTRRWAWLGYIAFTIASGTLNVAQVAPSSLGAWVYAVFPTCAIALLGFLASDAEALARRSAKASERRAQPAKESEQGNGHKSHTCPYCERSFAHQNGLNAHQRHCKMKVRIVSEGELSQ